MRGDVTTTPGHEPKDAPPAPYLPTLVSRGARGCRSGGEPCAMARIWSAIAVEVGSVRGAPTACDSAGVSSAPGPACRASAAALAAATALAIAWLAMCSASRGEAWRSSSPSSVVLSTTSASAWAACPAKSRAKLASA